MDLERVAPELRDPVRRLPVPPVRSAVVRRLVGVATRLLRSPKVDGVSVRVLRDEGIRARVFTPGERQTDAALLWIHGGGLVIGAAKQDDRLCAETSAALGMPVISIEYRLAPEHPFPAALDDALAAWGWVQRHADDLGARPDRIVVGGESAGGGVAASLAQRLRDDGGAQPIAQWLFAPMLDDRTSADGAVTDERHFVWDHAANRFGWASYLGTEPGAASVPLHAVAARAADLSGLPPAWLCVSDIELFHDEVVDYATRLADAGVVVELGLVPGAPHGFENWAADTTIARDLVARAHAWLRHVVA